MSKPEKNLTPPAHVTAPTGQHSSAAEPLLAAAVAVPTREIGGRPGPEPTRFGDWERAGRCIDF